MYTESGLHNLVKCKDWAHTGTCKYCPDIYYQLNALYTLIRNNSIPLLTSREISK